VREDELDRIMERSKQHPDQPFADAGAATERILASGAQRRHVCILLRYAAYGAVFDTLYEIDPERAGVDCKDLIGLYEFLLSADPSEMEGRPGSADAITLSAHHKPAGSSLGGFRTPATAHSALSFMAGIRNLAQEGTVALLTCGPSVTGEIVDNNRKSSTS
jgi:hypothetical protein